MLPFCFIFMSALACTAWSAEKASNPVPLDGARCVDPDTYLSWSPGCIAASHDVYLGTDFDDVNNATVMSPEYKGQQEPNTYNPGELASNTAYYWRIDEVNDPNIWKGDVWSFEIQHNYFGLTHCPLGDAILIPDGNYLLVDCDGSTGDDGVRIGLNENVAFWEADINFGDPCSIPVDANMVLFSIGVVDGVPDRPVGRSILQKTAEDEITFSVDFTAVQPDSITAEYYLAGEHVLTETIAMGGYMIEAQDPCKIKVKVLIDWWFDVDIDYDASREKGKRWAHSLREGEGEGLNVIPMTGGSIIADYIKVYTNGSPMDDGLFNYSDVRMYAKDIPSFIIENEDFQLLTCRGFIQGDLNKDCYVDFLDFAIFADNWLECSKADDANCTFGL
jgi:hypothetical protein